jgi:predicted Zn-dependent protease with MMP-like domain/Flp pilus assembly protein TadD
MRRKHRPDERATVLVDDAADAFDRGDFARALAKADAACARDPGSVAAHHYRAAALAELGRLEESRAAYAEALRADPDDAEALLGAADLHVTRLQAPDADRELAEEGLALARRGAKRAKKLGDEPLEAEFALLEGMAQNQLGECKAALARLDAALAVVPDDPDALLERGIALFELCRFADARSQLQKLLERQPDEPWAHHYLGLVLERGNDRDRADAEKRFDRARRLAPAEFPRPVRLAPDAFDEAVEAALASLPEPIKVHLGNVAVTVEELPADSDLTASDPPLSPAILGVFRGSSYGQRSSMDPWSQLPSSIVLYQKNLERFAATKRELIEQIGITLIHEVGHFLGFDEEDLWERGLE